MSTDGDIVRIHLSRAFPVEDALAALARLEAWEETAKLCGLRVRELEAQLEAALAEARSE